MKIKIFGYFWDFSQIFINFLLFSIFPVTRLGSAWHVSSTHIVAPYRSFSREKIPGMIGAYIGLMHVNITLKGNFYWKFVRNSVNHNSSTMKTIFLVIQLFFFQFLALPVGNWSTRDIDFNEQFRWDAALDMHNSYRLALKRGLPYPILTVAEYFSLGREGFAWGGQYRAGNR